MSQHAAADLHGSWRLEWRDVATPELGGGRDNAVIRPLAVARCEIDPMLINAGPTAPDGFAVGHEAVAEVVAVGPGVSSVAVGQLVFASFQLCCGRCRACAGGRTANCAEYPALSDYGMQPLSGVEYGGMLSDLVHVPYADAMLVGVPAELDTIRLASVADNVCDGYRAVAPHLAARPGADVLVVCHGAPSIAMWGIQFHIGRVNSAAMLPEVAGLIGKGRLDPAIVTSDVIAWDRAATSNPR